jgi:hypothetical protein
VGFSKTLPLEALVAVVRLLGAELQIWLSPEDLSPATLPEDCVKDGCRM